MLRLLYFFDDHIKKYIMKGKKYCNPTNTGIIGNGISCIRENDVYLNHSYFNGFKNLEKNFGNYKLLEELLWT